MKSSRNCYLRKALTSLARQIHCASRFRSNFQCKRPRSTSMYAVIQTGGKQYRVEEGRTIRIEKLDGDAGAEISFPNVLLFTNGDDIQVGTPLVSGVKVTGQIVEQGRDKKLVVFKMRRRKAYRRLAGHRQAFTAVKITGIKA